MPEKNFSILKPLDFLTDVEDEARNAKSRFWAQAMEVEHDQTTQRLFQAMIHAAGNGVDTRLHIDWYSLLLTDEIFNYLPVSRFNAQKRLERLARKKQFYRQLEGEGVKVVLINKPSIISKLLPTFKRNHMKLVIIDNNLWIGGVNFNNAHFHYHDFMAKFTNPQFTDPVGDLFQNIEKQEAFEDYAFTIDSSNTFFVDSGKRATSIILSNAEKLLKEAKESIKFTTAFFPDGDVLKILYQKKKAGISVEVVTAQPSILHGFPRILNSEGVFMMHIRRMKIPIRYLKNVIHSKLIIVDDKAAMFGSHNYTGKGVVMQTGEIALKTTEPTIVRNVLSYYSDLPN